MAAYGEKIKELLHRGVVEVIDAAHLEKRLLEERQLHVKLGVDPTSPDMHLGNAALLLKLRDFQELGHQAILIIGDFTGEIGDTSDKESERPMLSKQQVKSNMKTYVKQVKKVLHPRGLKIFYNSKWLAKMTFREIAQQANLFSLSDFIARTNIKMRIKSGSRISLREVLYPLLQGYDSVKVKADVEIGATDQRFNMLAGRAMQQHFGQEPQDIIMMNLISGTDGKKMSKSRGNTINITDEPDIMFGKVMSIPDSLILPYFIHCTRVSMQEIELYARGLASNKISPRDVKTDLAYEITKTFWGERHAAEARSWFIAVFRDKHIPEKIQEARLGGNTITDALIRIGFAVSKSEARRLIEQRGIKIDGKAALDPDIIVRPGSVIQKGKRHFMRVI
ncbi:MAG: tyrosine--tRNA ligase [Candidatus Ryanbacteria bacterium RIFCSPHIGHO2_02_FULL_45_43]|uniref:Tyrosine--tRNA ligase n=1 Tax=Candidatus Ryanbacteria bacterium RIFCSPHIGHO2_01_45_13 TaxID=1802112 RepID=A0A1G2FY56_9BACT|nr:MAG: tyrosine--tRNA ligase [Candidatus Ryanbacteria bacterium RIFCSPHIGHO2_01_FULL_44_130]OGZ42999.1 MAG: tyrosine--tRNA ligase [Candidatus Ryanbacteria bacterium RIFCSPHIGHO2_01_45_13]OGZ48704.1 MAG: tyrosine--tRNA ligase [Candidatus Ryanbacteria bacterium RIFCSPHIGHO2_02_FULL_45_43]OGZ50644.1 MAG: tyrosine--tRNA ligase [Candidatus Ryanbacteria bacterium RIFCSPHIGHO2_12_FULL_44_20]OGZ51950.1 MAG: tyrosine--tRNA ligase [Candidatus Ryanbacteria bacterium RIFCSPLOWO2_01_FULL_44_230]OGZ53965.1